MARAAVEDLLFLMDQAFEGGEWHSLLSNLRAVTPEDWSRRPDGGHRMIRDIVRHVGGCKLMYHDYAFGTSSLWWDQPDVTGEVRTRTSAEAIEWLREGQGLLRRSLESLDDSELTRPRPTNWGELRETRWIFATMIEHDLYHAGEINHLRSLLQGTDRWEYDGP